MTLSWTELSSKLEASAREKRIPYSLSFELTARCNQQCKMCYLCVPAHDKQAQVKELSAAQWLDLARQARSAGLLQVTLTGGEIFLRQDFKEIYKGLVDLGLIVQFLTNGTLITTEMINWLKTIPPYRINITIYGASKSTCAKITGYADSYERTIGAIDALLAAGINTAIRTTVVQGNSQDYDKLSDFARERGLTLGVVNYISPRREGINSNPLGNRLSSEDLVQYENHIAEHNLKIWQDDGKHTILYDSGDQEAMNNKGKLFKAFNDPNDPFQCYAGKSSGWITWDGRLIACGLMSKPQTNPLESGFLAAWEELKYKCSLIPICHECAGCEYKEYCERCPARLLNETGAFDRPASYLCETANKRYNQNKL